MIALFGSWALTVAIGWACTALVYALFGTVGAMFWLAGVVTSVQWADAWDRRSRQGGLR